jgi:2',3'-cyclic-nucleotide 2'-phosphodiesterase/3'-nucleotidase/5'-nucleotidase
MLERALRVTRAAQRGGMTNSIRRRAFAALVLLAACGDDDGPLPMDSGVESDAAFDGGLDAATDSDGGFDAGRDGTDAGTDAETDAGTDAGPPPAFTLQLLHVADGEANASAIEDYPRFAQVLAGLRATDPTHTLTLSSGDNWIPGPFLDASGDPSLNDELGIARAARADVAAMNAMGFQAAAFGNHEFDLGAAAVYSALAPETREGATWEGALFPYLSSNLTFVDDPAANDLFELVVDDGAAPAPASIARSVVIEVDGVRFGIVGATTPLLPSISSPGTRTQVAPTDAMDVDALAAIVQSSVDALTDDGIDHVILLAHMQQIAIERMLAARLRDVDVVVAGGSNTLLADATDRLRAGDAAAGTYPEILTSASGEPVALVNTDGRWRYVGRLVVGFDEDGVLLPGSIDDAVSGAYATDEAGAAAFAAFAADESVTRVRAITNAVRDVLVARESVQFGYTDHYLEGRRGAVRTQETNLGNLVCDAMLWLARSFDPATSVCVRNGGGIRASIGEIYVPPGSMGESTFLPPQAIPAAGKEEGEISQFDIQTALSFNNDLTLLTLTPAEMRALLEHVVAGVAPGATPGAFGQVGGVSFSFDPTRAAGDRVRNASVLDASGARVARLVTDGVTNAAAGNVRIVTLGFLAGGGDSYPLGALSAPSRVDLDEAGLTAGAATFAPPGTEQDTLAEYLLTTHATAGTAFGAADVPASMDERVQNLAVRSDAVP